LTAAGRRGLSARAPFAIASVPAKISAPASGRKVLHLPGSGPATFDYLSLQSNDNPDLRLSILTPI